MRVTAADGFHCDGSASAITVSYVAHHQLQHANFVRWRLADCGYPNQCGRVALSRADRSRLANEIKEGGKLCPSRGRPRRVGWYSRRMTAEYGITTATGCWSYSLSTRLGIKRVGRRGILSPVPVMAIRAIRCRRKCLPACQKKCEEWCEIMNDGAMQGHWAPSRQVPKGCLRQD